MKANVTSTVTLRIPKSMKRDLEFICKEGGVDASTIIRESLQRIIALHKFRFLRNQCLPYAERAGIFSDEDILRFRS